MQMERRVGCALTSCCGKIGRHPPTGERAGLRAGSTTRPQAREAGHSPSRATGRWGDREVAIDRLQRSQPLQAAATRHRRNRHLDVAETQRCYHRGGGLSCCAADVRCPWRSLNPGRTPSCRFRQPRLSRRRICVQNGTGRRNERRSVEIAGRRATCPASAESERHHSKTGNGDREKETGGNEPMKRPHDRTPLFDQTIDCCALPSSRMNSSYPLGQV